MSNLIPPLLSSSPPPIVGPLDEDDDDEFGDFRAAADSFDCDDFSLPPSPQKSSELKTDLSKVNLDINSNKSQKDTHEMPAENLDESVVREEVNKDFQDRRKSLSEEDAHAEIKVNSSEQFDEVNGFEVDFSDQNIEENDFTNPQSALPNETQVENEVNNHSNEENLFEAFSENTNDTSESNEIKSDDNFSEEINDKGENDLSESSVSLKISETEQKSTEDDFGDFENHFSNDKEALDDDFDDFVEPPQQGTGNDEDFGDFESSEFGDFSHNCEKPAFLEIDVKNAFEKCEAILKEIFPNVEQESDDYMTADYTTENRIFDELKDVTETNALIYQWSKSNSQKMFLKSLNIDTRNILYGPAWGGSMPRFAGLTPLEPVKTEILTPAPVQNFSSPSSNSSQKEISDIPTVQFDWNGSGLINPLDCYNECRPVKIPKCRVSPTCPQRNYVSTCPHSSCCTTRASSAPCKRTDWNWNTNNCRTRRSPSLEPTATKLEPRFNEKRNDVSKPKTVKSNKMNKSPQRRKVSNERKSPETSKQNECCSGPEEHEYVHFLLKITEDILRNNIYKDNEMEKLFESHIQANKGRLDEERMRSQIEKLKQELNLPLPKREQMCECGEENGMQSALCKCCEMGTQSETTCYCNNEKCPLHPISEEKPEPIVDAVSLEEEPEPKYDQECGSPDDEPEKDESQCDPECGKLDGKTPSECDCLNVEKKSDESNLNMKTSLSDITEISHEENGDEEKPEEDVEDVIAERDVSNEIEEDEKNPTIVKSEEKVNDDPKVVEDVKTSKHDLGPSCIDPQHCSVQEPSEYVNSPKRSTEHVNSPKRSASGYCSTNGTSVHSMVKIINKDDPDNTESQIIFYNVETGTHCFCSVSFQKTALKIQVDGTENEEYILVDGPVCMPRTMLEKKTIPVLIQNVSSLLLNSELNEDVSDDQSLSRVNLLQRSEYSVEGPLPDVADSVSVQIKKIQGGASFGFLPDADNVEVVATPTVGLDPILKKSEESRKASKEIEWKISETSETTEADEVENFPVAESQSVPTGNMGKTPKCPSRSCKSNKGATTSQTEETHSKEPSKGENGVTNAPDKLADKHSPELVHFGNVEDDPTKLFESSYENLPSDDPARKYHFLLMDVATSTTSYDVDENEDYQIHEQGEQALRLSEDYQIHEEDEPALPKDLLEEEIPEPVEIPEQAEEIVSPLGSPNEGSITEDYRLLTDDEYEAEKPPRTLGEPERQSFGSNRSSDRADKDLRIFEYSFTPTRGSTSRTPGSRPELAYIGAHESGTITSEAEVRETDLDERAAQPPGTLPLPRPSLSDSSSQRKPHEGLKVRYSLNRDLFDQEHQDIIAKLDQMPKIEPTTLESRNASVAAITDRMEEFRKIGDDNANRRFQISNADNFEIRRVSNPSVHNENEDEKPTRPSCCGLVQPPKSKKRVANSETWNEGRMNF
ncbi:uncharacterized protein LOC123011934 [Tribolium madens]|uniref:uncharacterized protein LOC123011934 n=1 Tax=Tribolium madens TaxID=41895 RepID=UPI001CF76602|nr:uncharacterized protein LOC123011934 [Tribolium madens]